MASSTEKISPRDLKPHLHRCGYDDERVVEKYRFNGSSVPLACFSSRPHDTRSACIAVIDEGPNVELEVAAVRETGAPIVLVCGESRLEWWKQTVTSPLRMASVPTANVANLFDEHRESWTPSSIYEAKTRGRLPGHHQLDFIDVGLMPMVEDQAGRKLSELLARSMKRIEDGLGSDPSGKPSDANNLYKSVFWLVAAKMLRDKEVPGFKTLDLLDVNDVFLRVGRHYGDTKDIPPGGRKWRPAIEAAAELVSQFSHLGNVSTEALAHVYENTGVPKELRKALGIHSTPSSLVDYIVWQLWPWVAEIAEEQRHVFEPACGHAGFLVAMLRQLSQWSLIKDGKERHKYLRHHLHGLEYDPFALEVAKLSLTLADIPHGNSWDLKQGNMFVGDTLATEAARAMVLLANPPYEPFSGPERSRYGPSSKTKACELVKRTLPHLQHGACFGFVVPRGFLSSDEAQTLRSDLLTGFELAEIAVFEDGLFEHGDHEVAVLMGRRRGAKSLVRSVAFNRVRNKDMDAFHEEFRFSSTDRPDLALYAKPPKYIIRVPELASLWLYVQSYPKLESFATVGRGLSFVGKDKRASKAWTVRSQRAGDSPGFHLLGSKLSIYGLPEVVGMNLSKEVVDTFRYGRPTGAAQVLFNYAPVSRGAWRIKAFIDTEGRAFTSNFVALRPARESEDCIWALWALMNSPFASAYARAFLGKRHHLEGQMRMMPIPQSFMDWAPIISGVAQRFYALASADDFATSRTVTTDSLKQTLLEMDAAVLKAYDLPPKLERELLDFFEGEERPGVGVPFTGYFPPEMKAYIPLHEFISDEYQRSTVGALRARHKVVEDERILNALKVAAESFGEE
jgi:hypothetical protein